MIDQAQDEIRKAVPSARIIFVEPELPVAPGAQ